MSDPTFSGMGTIVFTECPACGGPARRVTAMHDVFYCDRCETSFEDPGEFAEPVSPDIITVEFIPDPDPDPEEPTMTEATATVTLDRPTETLTARKADEVAKLIADFGVRPGTRNYLQRAKGGEGSGSLGLYVEAVVHTAAGDPFTHMRFFVVDRLVFAYNRSKGDKRANWRRRVTPSLPDALGVVQKAIDRPNVKLFGHPVLVELTADDIGTMEAGGMPPARFRGVARIEKDFGRYDFDMEITATSLPITLGNALRETATPK